MRPLTASRHASPRGAYTRPQTSARRDPAPTLWAYRLQRMMLTPFLRGMVRIGLPAALVLGGTGIVLSDAGRREAITQYLSEIRENFEQRPEFMVTSAVIEGSSPALADAVRARIDLDLPRSSFALDLTALQARIAGLDAVETVDLRMREGGTLAIVVTERRPVAIWRHGDTLTLVDTGGHRVASLVARTDAPDLPLIAGEGAADAVPEALALVAAAAPLVARLRGFVRMGERRWDLVLDRGQRILLPAAEPVRALEQFLALDQAQQILARDVVTVDLRLPARPTLRLGEPALDALAALRGGSPRTPDNDEGGRDL